MWVLELENFRFCEVNEAALLHYGFERQEFLSKTIFDLLPHDEAERFESCKSGFSQPGLYSGPWDHLKKDGSRIHAEITASLVDWEDRPCRLVLARDVTEEKRNLEELKLLHHCIERINDGIIITEADPIEEPGPRIIYVNGAFEKITGYKRSEIIGRSPRFLHGVHSRKADLVMIRQAISEKRATKVELINYRKDGTEFDAEMDLTPVCLEGDQVSHYVGIQRDITERKRSIHKLAEQAALLDKATDAIMVTDFDSRVLYWNNAAAQIYGWSREEMMGEKFLDKCCSDLVKARETLQYVMRNDQWQGELIHRVRDGSLRTMDVRRTLMSDESGKGVSILSINTDITEKKKMEMQFLRSQRLESIGILAGGIAHDLNNVLAPILLSIELLREKIKDEDGIEIIQTIKSCANHGADLIRQVLSFSRGIEGQKVPVNLHHLANDIQTIVRDTFPRNIRLEMRADPDLHAVLGDATQLHQVLMNLCLNARDAMPDGGHLRLNLQNITLDASHSAVGTTVPPGSYVLVRVADTGTGIAPGLQNKIFEPFFTTKKFGQGTGLGLSTVLSIVKSHGGFLVLESKLKEGTTFSLYFPLVEHEPIPEREAITRRALRGHGEMIMVVDDEEAVCFVLRQILELNGYKVIVATHGAEAVAHYARNADQVALVLTDMVMPVMDGPAMVVALRSINPHVRVIGSSGLVSDEQMRRMEDCGIQSFIPKPYNAETILLTVRQVLEAPVRV
jgi:PAS domain S-box-containing protein